MVWIWAILAAWTPFTSGETLRFSVRYGPIQAGKMTLEVLPMEVWGQDTVWHFRTRAWTEGPIRWLFTVVDQIDSWVSTTSFATRRYVKHLREGRYQAQVKVDYIPSQGIAVYPDTTLKIPRGALDPLALYYFLRQQNLAVGETLRVPFHVDRRSRMLRIRIVMEEEIQTPKGRFRCWVVEPDLKGAGFLKGKGHMKVWISKDPQRLPVKIQTKLAFGALTAVLEAVHGGGS